jgi:pilus assembly protein CpaB
MNPRQRRGLLLIALAGIGLIMVFVLVAGYVADVRSEVEPRVGIVRLADDVAANELLTDRVLREVEVPERYAPPRALRDTAALTGLVAGTDLPRGAVMQQGMAVAPPELEEGQREIAILVDAETGVAGKVGPGAIVDVVATFDAERSGSGGPQSRIAIAGARVIDVGQPAVRDRPGSAGAQVDPSQVVPVTFALSVRDALTLTFAESFASEVRLALTRPGDTEVVPESQRSFPPTDADAEGDT